MESKQADEILAAIPWRCFHCDFITGNPDEARAHFGDGDDGSEFVPVCKWWAKTEDAEKLEAYQDCLKELDGAREDSGRLNMRVEDLEYQVGAQLNSIRSYKPFKDCVSIYDIFCLYDSMEGRALAAEEELTGVNHMTLIRMHQYAIEAIEDNGEGEIATFNPTAECIAAFNRSETERLKALSQPNWGRRLLIGFGVLAILVALCAMWADGGRP